MNQKLPYYIHCFEKLKRDMKNGGAPHKPVLLLAVINMYETEVYHSNHLEIVPELVASFKSIWSQVVESNHHALFALPFYHMSSEPFWKLVANPGCEQWVRSKGAMRSLNNLITAVQYASIDMELFELLTQPMSREVLKATLLNKYFPHLAKPLVYQDELNKRVSLVHDSSDDYKSKLNELKRAMDLSSYQEEVFIRSGVFKREVPKIYHNTCAISGWRLDALVNVSMVDACHIVPFSESYDDSLQNGIALSPNLHRAFDRGLIALSDDYRVITNNNFSETPSVFSIKQFDGMQILLPKDDTQYPGLENLRKHRERFGL